MAEDERRTENFENHNNEELRFTYRLDTWKKLISGVFIVIGISFSWVGSSQFTENTYTKSFNAPAFMMWFSTSWMALSYLPVVIFSLLMKKSIKETYRSDEQVFGPDGLCPKTLFKILAPFCVIWCFTNYCYTRALGKVAVTDVTAMFSSCSAFVYIFSLLILKEPFQATRVVSVILSISGVVMFAYEDGFKGPSFEGVFLSILSAIGAALYKVMFKRVFGDTSANRVSLFLTILGLFNFLLLWPPFEILYFTREEAITWSDIPWDFLCGRSILGLIFNFLINFGIAFTFPLFISLGTILGIPLNGIVDSIYRNERLGWLKIGASFMIVIGFLLMLYPGKSAKKMKPKEEENLITKIINP